MHQNFKEFTKKYFADILEGMGNIFIFLPYFFSVSALFKTLFYPWKNITDNTKKPGFSIQDILNKAFFNLVSRFIGGGMRGSIILFFFLILCLYITLIPFIFIVCLLYMPVKFTIASVTESEDSKKSRYRESFIKSHLLKSENYQAVEKWFEYIYDLLIKHHSWWKMKNLLSVPPLARDWSAGYTPSLDKYCEDMTDPSFQMGIREHIIGREQETAMIERALSKSDEANAVLVGVEGVGKHTIINSFAKKIYEGRTNSLLMYKRLLRLDMEKILSEETDIKKREEALDQLLKEAVSAKNIIILIDNFHRFTSSGGDNIDLSEPIFKYASKNSLQILGITTPFNYENFIFPNSGIKNIFTKIDVSEIPKDKALYILLDKTVEFEKRYKITIPYETVFAVIEKSDFYITNIPFPEKALQLLDNACVYTTQTLKKPSVMPDVVDTVLTLKTHVQTTMTDQIKQELLRLESLLEAKILGQSQAIEMISSSLRRSFLLMGKRKKPIATFLFLGPTGVGKTETAKAINEVFFGKESEINRFDMSNFQSKEDIPVLLGSIEKLSAGLLTKAVREHPYGVLLLDELEKAHPDLLNIFLTMLDEGYFTDGYGQKVDCKNLIVIATSNAASSEINKLLSSQTYDTATIENFQTNLLNYLTDHGHFKPEFLNRFDGVVAYSPLNTDIANQLAARMMDKIAKQIFDIYKVKVIVSEDKIRELTEKGYNIQYGARDLERIFRQNIEDQIAKIILEGKAKEGDAIRL